MSKRKNASSGTGHPGKDSRKSESQVENSISYIYNKKNKKSTDPKYDKLLRESSATASGKTRKGSKPNESTGQKSGKGFFSRFKRDKPVEEENIVVDESTTNSGSSEGTETVVENSASQDEASFQAEIDAGIID
ncbi:MAG: hypothetical protein AAGF07_05565 [Patescibacteria group bacterium]